MSAGMSHLSASEVASLSHGAGQSALGCTFHWLSGYHYFPVESSFWWFKVPKQPRVPKFQGQSGARQLHLVQRQISRIRPGSLFGWEYLGIQPGRLPGDWLCFWVVSLRGKHIYAYL